MSEPGIPHGISGFSDILKSYEFLIRAPFMSLLWKVELLMLPFPQELRPRNEISGNISRTPEFLITVGVSDAVDLFVNQLCHSHVQTRFPT